MVIVLLSLAACTHAPGPAPQGPPHLEIYNVQDLVSCVTSFGSCEIPNDPEGCVQFERKAKAAFAQVPWNDDTGLTLVMQNGLLIVRADDATQRSVRAYLESERSKLAK